MQLKSVLAAAGAALALCSAAAIAGPEEKFRADLGDVFDGAGAGELVPVTIVLKDQAGPFDIDQLRSMNKADRRQFVIDELQGVAADTQGRVIGVLNQAERAGDAGMVNPLWIANVVAAQVTEDVALQIAALEEVAWLNYDRPVGEEVFPTIREPDHIGGMTQRGVECGVQAMNAPLAWDAGYTGTGIVVGMIDTGTCITHSDIANQIWTNAGEIAGNGIDDDSNGFVDDVHGWSWDGNGSNSDINDYQGHGSHTAGTVGGDGTAGTECGMAPDSEIQTLKFYNNLAGESSVWNGMQYGLANGSDVQSASLGWLHAWNPDRVTWRTLSENTFAAGVVVVFAAGNEGSAYGIDSVRTPGDVPDMITVGATNCSMNITGFSSRGPVTWQNVNGYNDWPYPPGKLKPTISAPGDFTTSHSICGGYTQMSGTSMATPHVSGAVALILQANPGLDHYQVKQILKDTAIDRGTSGEDNTYGYGFVDAWAAVQAALDAGCDADFNADGAVNTLDVRDFLNAWASGAPEGDINGDGVNNTLDVTEFLNLWVPGC